LHQNAASDVKVMISDNISEYSLTARI